jgi:hypothetical protein
MSTRLFFSIVRHTSAIMSASGVKIVKKISPPYHHARRHVRKHTTFADFGDQTVVVSVFDAHHEALLTVNGQTIIVKSMDTSPIESILVVPPYIFLVHASVVCVAAVPRAISSELKVIQATDKVFTSSNIRWAINLGAKIFAYQDTKSLFSASASDLTRTCTFARMLQTKCTSLLTYVSLR